MTYRNLPPVGDDRAKLRQEQGAKAVRDVRTPATVMSLVLLAVLIGVNLDPKVRQVQAKAFGDEPLGMPVTVAFVAATLVLSAPLYWVFRHAMVVVAQAMRDGAGTRLLGFMIYLARVGRLHPELRRSQAVAVWGMVYAFVLLGAWIAFANYRGV
jgi:hypothetical protein